MAGAMSASVGDLRAFITNSRRDKTCTNVEERERPDWSDVRREGGPAAAERAAYKKGLLCLLAFLRSEYILQEVHMWEYLSRLQVKLGQAHTWLQLSG